MARKPKLLIANRGEIALRIVRTAREMGIPTVPCTPMPTSTRSTSRWRTSPIGSGRRSHRTPTCRSERFEAAQKARATLIHPGYGFLAERALFAAAVVEAGFTFVGPLDRREG